MAPDHTIRAAITSRVERLEVKLEELSLENKYLVSQVQHKSSTGVFATASAISEFMKAAGLIADGPTYQAVARAQTRLVKRRRA